MYSQYAAASSFPAAMTMALECAFMAAEDELWDDPVQRPAVPGAAEQELDTDYDPDPGQEATPLKNVPKNTPKPLPKKKPARK